MGLLKLILSFFTFWINIRAKYDRIKNNEERREKSVRMGVRSIIQTVLCSVIAVLAFYGAVVCLKYTASVNLGMILSLIAGIFCILATLVSLIQGVLGGMLYMIYQLRLNRRPIGWVALAIWLLLVIAIIVFAVCIYNGVWIIDFTS